MSTWGSQGSRAAISDSPPVLSGRANLGNKERICRHLPNTGPERGPGRDGLWLAHQNQLASILRLLSMVDLMGKKVKSSCTPAANPVHSPGPSLGLPGPKRQRIQTIGASTHHARIRTLKFRHHSATPVRTTEKPHCKTHQRERKSGAPGRPYIGPEGGCACAPGSSAARGPLGNVVSGSPSSERSNGSLGGV